MRRALAVVAVGLGLAAGLVWLRPGRPADGGRSATAPRRRLPAPPLPAPSAPIPRNSAPPLRLRDGGAGSIGVILRAGWGSGPGQLGHRLAPGAAAQGPSSFVAGSSGFVVVDSVNQRLARFDAHGQPLAPIALAGGAQDLARGAGDRLALLALPDRQRGGKVTLLDADGRTLATTALAGPGVSDATRVSGIFADRSGAIVVESDPRTWLTIFDASGAAARPRTPLPGRPTRDGGYVSATVANRDAGSVLVHRFGADGGLRWDTVVLFNAPLVAIALLDSDAAGHVYLGVRTAQPTQAGAAAGQRLQVAAIVDSDRGGRIEPEQLDVDAPPPREEASRDLSVGDDGTIYWMRRTPDGVVIEAYRL